MTDIKKERPIEELKNEIKTELQLYEFDSEQWNAIRRVETRMINFFESLLEGKDKKYATLEQFAKKLNENWKRGEQEREEMIKKAIDYAIRYTVGSIDDMKGIKKGHHDSQDFIDRVFKQFLLLYLETKPNKDA